MSDDNSDILPVYLKGKPLRYAANMREAVEAMSVPLPRGLVLVTAKSPPDHFTATETMARCFLREMGYDTVQFAAYEYKKSWYNPRPATDDKIRSFLWYDTEDGRPGQWPAIGGCTFRLKGRNPSFWELGWVGILPEKRRQGLFRNAWPFFRAMFGMLIPSTPISPALAKFLLSIGYPAELEAYYGSLAQDESEKQPG